MAIVISDDAPPPISGTVGLPLTPTPPDGGPGEVYLTLSGIDWNNLGTTGTVAYYYTHVGVRPLVYFPRYGPVLLTTSAIGLLHHLLYQSINTPTDGFDPTIPGLRIALRGCLREGAEVILRGEDNPDFYYLHPDRTFVNSAYFGLVDIPVIHIFLEIIIRSPTAGFFSSVSGLHFPIMALVR